MKQAKILIIGAGTAGLAAAGKLVQAGIEVTILEARDRAGGRISTMHADWPRPIEAGPEFIHSDSTEFDALMREGGVVVGKVPDRHSRMVDGVPREVDFDPVWEKIFSRMEKYDGPDLSFLEFLNRHCSDASPDERIVALEYVEGFNAADASDVSLLWLRKSEAAVGAADSQGIRRIVNGYDRITKALLDRAAGCDLRLNTRVAAVRWQPGKVEVELAEGSECFVADAAIVTLPLGVLQRSLGVEGFESQLAGHAAWVRFEPDLPEKRGACRLLRMGAIVKAMLWFREAPWKSLGRGDAAAELLPGFLHVPGAAFMTWWPMDDSLMVTGWSGGPRAKAISLQSDEDILATAVSDLARGLGVGEDRIRASLVDHRVFNWQRDPRASGAYSYAAVGGSMAADQLAEPIEGTLFFAGEATEGSLTATVGGALKSGFRAADELLRQFGQS